LVRQASESNICGWIVDLTQNSGGNMWPMLTGLREILGDEPYGWFVDADRIRPWLAGAQGGSASLDDRRASSSRLLPVAVAIGARTASSGEMVAIAFKGRPKSTFFGASTAGLVTGNVVRPLSDGSQLLITGTRVADRDGNLINSAIRPDVESAGPVRVSAVADWFRSEGCEAKADAVRSR
jgi:C-terminal processing protease CtpA/Prc